MVLRLVKKWEYGDASPSVFDVVLMREREGGEERKRHWGH